MCRFREAELYMVSTNMRLIPELRQLEMGMSTNRYLPAMGTAGLERVAVNGNKRVPAPPPKITDNTSLLIWLVYSFGLIDSYNLIYSPADASQEWSSCMMWLRIQLYNSLLLLYRSTARPTE